MKAVALSIVLFATLAVCQTEVQTAEPAAAKVEAQASAEETATFVFYRPKRFYGSGLTPSVYVDGVEVARMGNGRYFVLTVKPGTIKLSSSMKHDPTPTEAKAGKTEYFEMVILTGTWKGGGRLIPTPAADAKEALKKLKPLDKKWAKSESVTFVLPGEASAEAK